MLPKKPQQNLVGFIKLLYPDKKRVLILKIRSKMGAGLCEWV